MAASAILVSVDEGNQAYVPANLALVQRHSLVERATPLEPVPPFDPGQSPSDPPLAPRSERLAEDDLAAVAGVLPGARRVEVAYPYGFLIATPEVLDTFEIDAATRRLLSQHGAVRTGWQDETDHARLAEYGSPSGAGRGQDGSPFQAQVQALAEGAVRAPASRYTFVNQATLVSVDQAARHQLSETSPAVAFVSPRPLTAAQRDRLSDVQSANRDSGLRLASASAPTYPSDRSFVTITAADPDQVPTFVIYAVFDGLALLFTGFVIVVGLALAAAETREEVEVLTAVGASPSSLRRLAATKAALLAGAGVVLALPTGLIPVWVVRNASSGSSRFILPWASLGLLVLVLPATLALLALGGSAVHARFSPVTASTMTAD